MLVAWMLFSANRLINAITEEKQQKSNLAIEEYNRKYRVSPHELPRFIAWAVGEENMLEFSELIEGKEEIVMFDHLVDMWNKNHGKTLFLYARNGFQHNYNQMLTLWVNVGKP